MSLEFNKVAGAVLGSLVFAMGVGFVAELIFHVDPPETPGFQVAVAEDAPAEAGGEEASGEEPIAVRLASADEARGESLSRACGACHVFDPSNANRVGPGLWDVVGSQPAANEGYAYSPALVEFAQDNVWDYEHLDAFLASPKDVVPGTKMAYAGMRRPDDRASLIAYLRTLSENPQPLPDVQAATDQAPADATPAEEAPADAGPAGEAPAQDAAPEETAPAPAPAEAAAPENPDPAPAPVQ
jgi:cytochrome c